MSSKKCLHWNGWADPRTSLGLCHFWLAPTADG